MKTSLLLLLPGALSLFPLLSCSQNREQENIAAFVTEYDATQALERLRARNNRAQLADKRAWVSDTSTINVIYGPNGSVIYSGSPSGVTETVQLDAAGGPVQVSAMSDPQGSYVTFTPAAIYYTNRATGARSYLPRHAAAGARSAVPAAGSAPSAAAAPAPSPATAPQGMTGGASGAAGNRATRS